MPVNEGLYAHVETEFLRSSRFLSLPSGARCLYLSIWAYALEQRREIIERPTDYYLSSMAGLKHHPITSYLHRMHILKLLIVNDRYIAVIGLRKKHKKINFKDEFENTGIEFEKSQDSSFLSFPSLSVPFRSSTPDPKGSGVPETKKPKPKKSPSLTAPNPDIKIFIDWYFNEHFDRFGTKLIVSGQDGSHIKRLLQTIGIDELKIRAGRFLDDGASWPKGDKSIRFFSQNINRYATGDAPMTDVQAHNRAVLRSMDERGLIDHEDGGDLI